MNFLKVADGCTKVLYLRRRQGIALWLPCEIDMSMWIPSVFRDTLKKSGMRIIVNDFYVRNQQKHCTPRRDIPKFRQKTLLWFSCRTGVSGLTCARLLQRSLPHASITLLEASERLGGLVRTSKGALYTFLDHFWASFASWCRDGMWNWNKYSSYGP